MEDYRYWQRIDASPLIRALTFRPPPSSHTAGLTHLASADDEELSEDEEQAAIAALDDSVDDHRPRQFIDPPLGDQAAKAEKSAKPKVAQLSGATLPQAPTEVQEDKVKPAARPTALQITSSTIGPLKAHIEHPQGLHSFWKAIEALATDASQLVRVRHYGDSHLANDGISLVLRTLLQRRFGDGGHGFSSASARTKWYRRKGVKWSSNKAWRTKTYLGGGQRDRAYGYGGVVSLGRAGAQVRVETTKSGVGSAVNRFRLYWRAVAKASVDLTIDGVKQRVEIGNDKLDHTRVWQLNDGPHRVTLRVIKGRTKIYGLGFERDRGLIYDSLGITGARARRWLKVDTNHLQEQFVQRPAQLVVINYGGNSRGDRISPQGYRRTFGETIEKLRGSSAPACLVLSPTDHGVRNKGKIISDPQTVKLIAWQRKVAIDQGCAFLDTRALMGGAGSMGRWVKQGLGWSDYSHLTAKGQRRLGRSIYGALMEALQQRLTQERP